MEKPFTPGIQILLLFGLTLTMGMLSQLAFGVVMAASHPGGISQALLEDPWIMLTGALFFHLFSHFAAFLLFLRFTGFGWRGLIFFDRPKPLMLLLIPVLLLVSFLAIEALSYASFWVFETTGGYSFIEAEMQHQQLQTTIFTHADPLFFTFSIFVAAVVPAIGEELIYRGILFTRLVEATNNVHFSALISGLIFAALHGHPVQLLPIAAMGIGLAYIYYYTRNIWYNIILHFLVNAVQIAVYFFWPEVMG